MSADYVKKPDLRILAVIAGLAASFERLWCFPNQKTIQRLLAVHHGIRMSLRQLNRHLGALTRDGYLSRQRRHNKKKTGSLVLHSTLYCIKAHGVATFAKLGKFLAVAGAHSWSKQWVSAVTKTAERMELHINIMPPPPKKQAGFG